MLWPIAVWTFNTIRPFLLISVVIAVLYAVCTQMFMPTIVSWLEPLRYTWVIMVDTLTTTFSCVATSSKAFMCVIPALHGLCAQLSSPVELYSEHMTPTVTALNESRHMILTTVESLRSFTASLSSVYVALPPAECDVLHEFLHKSRILQAAFDAYSTKNLLLIGDIGFRSAFLVDDLQKLVESPAYLYGAISLVGYPDHLTLSRASLLTTLESWSGGIDDLSSTAEIIAHHWTDYQIALGKLTFDMKIKRQQQPIGWWLDFSGFAVTLRQHAVRRDFEYLAKAVDMIQNRAPSVLASVDVNLSLAKSNLRTAQVKMPQTKSHLILAWERRNPSFESLLDDLRDTVARAQLSHKDRDASESSEQGRKSQSGRYLKELSDSKAELDKK
jgi:hypothetical protein